VVLNNFGKCHGESIEWPRSNGITQLMKWKTARKKMYCQFVIVHNPLAWLQSMCGNPYAVMWRHTKHHCPNLVPNDEDRAYFQQLSDHFPVKIKFDHNSHYFFNSLAHLWSEWHQQYLQADYPVLFSKCNFRA